MAGDLKGQKKVNSKTRGVGNGYGNIQAKNSWVGWFRFSGVILVKLFWPKQIKQIRDRANVGTPTYFDSGKFKFAN